MRTKYGLTPIIRLKEILEDKRLTQKELAEMLGETPQQVNKWVNGVEPCLSALGRIAMTLSVSPGDIVWHKGDDPYFGSTSKIYIRGEAAAQALQTHNTSEQLDILKQYYRWTDEELAGAKLIHADTEKGEITLSCTDDATSEAFISWAKKDRDCMYRL